VLYCNILRKTAQPFAKTMTHHHHQEDSPHPSAAIGASLLRFSAAQRLALAGIVIALLWAAFWWIIL